MPHDVPGGAQADPGARVFAGAEVAGELRLRAACDDQPDPRAGGEAVGGGPEGQGHSAGTIWSDRVEACVALGHIVRPAAAVDLGDSGE